MYSFGSGVLIGTPSGANPTPTNFGLVQEVTYDEAGTLKSLFGQNRRALAVGAGTVKTTLKAKTARISGLVLASLYYGTSLTSGQTTTAVGEAGTVPAVSTYTVTVSNAAAYVQDQGVVYAATGLPLTRVALVSAKGQYSVVIATGVYTFYSGDASAKVLISYNYTISTSGQSIAIPNPLIGPTISFGANLYTVDPTTNLGLTLQLYNVVSAKLSFGTKLEDFALPDFEAECFVNAAGLMGQWSLPDTF
jgi:hypothetical protein